MLHGERKRQENSQELPLHINFPLVKVIDSGSLLVDIGSCLAGGLTAIWGSTAARWRSTASPALHCVCHHCSVVTPLLTNQNPGRCAAAGPDQNMANPVIGPLHTIHFRDILHFREPLGNLSPFFLVCAFHPSSSPSSPPTTGFHLDHTPRPAVK